MKYDAGDDLTKFGIEVLYRNLSTKNCRNAFLYTSSFVPEASGMESATHPDEISGWSSLGSRGVAESQFRYTSRGPMHLP